MPFTVVITGRPNVGKSTLFNRLVGKREAIVAAEPGVTRDRREGEGRIGPLRFRVIDTGGLEEAGAESLEARLLRQTELALGGADVVLLLIDGRQGVTPTDRHFADWLRRRGLPIIPVVNKCEGREGSAGLPEAYALGLGDPVAISALQGEGLGDLYDALIPFAPEGAETGEEKRAKEAGEEPLRLAVIGRPNVGKSTLINRLLAQERFVTGPEPGLTREAIGVEWSYRGRPIVVIDTAGIRRRARITERLERLSVKDSLEAVRFAHVVVLVIDATGALEKQDLALAALIVEQGRAPVVAVNKWDLVVERRETLKRLRWRLAMALPQAKGVPFLPLSALTGAGVEDLLPAVLAADQTWNRRVSTGPLNRWLAAATTRHPAPVAEGRPNKLRYVTQIKARPPTFAVFASRPEKVPEAYRRYLINSLREAFGFAGVPMRLLLRRSQSSARKTERRPTRAP